ncbi:hypothetical protein [Hylemonella gracilis]|uniref:hypothetical protein n=1 Tax=Hylemonella gracilis TaxID=80880 RepID=UPI001A9409DA|nr:hypothetical protein [Hylemonella gracilis]
MLMHLPRFFAGNLSHCLWRLVLCVSAVCAGPVHAQDAEGEGGLRVPTRLTVGVGDQFLGQLAPPTPR